MSKSDALRWLLVVPASVAGFCLALTVMIFSQTYVESLCPAEYMVFGERRYCIYPAWVTIALTAIGGALAAFLFVYLGPIVAPGYKRVVPYVLFTGGGMIAAYMIALMGNSVGEYAVMGLSTGGAGMLTAMSLSMKGGG